MLDDEEAARRLAGELAAPLDVARALHAAGYSTAESVRGERPIEIEAAVPEYRAWREEARRAALPPPPAPEPRAEPLDAPVASVRVFGGTHARMGASVSSALALGVVLAAVGGVAAVALHALAPPEEDPPADEPISLYCHPGTECGGFTLRASDAGLARAPGVRLLVAADFDGVARASAAGTEGGRVAFASGESAWTFHAPLGESAGEWRIVISPAPGHEGHVRVLAVEWLEA